MEKRTSELFKDPSEFTVLAKFKGIDLKGKRYIPPFKYFEKVIHF